MEFVIGIDLGGTSIKAVAAERTGQTLATTNVSFDPEAKMDWAQQVREIVLGFQEKFGQPGHIGLSAPGLAAPDGSAIAYMPKRLQGLEGLKWADFLGCRAPVPVLNDAQAALLGEAWVGAARGCTNVFILTLGTGVGGAAIVDGRLIRGHIGRAGHLGHASLNPDGVPDVTGMPGSLEDTIGNCTIHRRTQGRFQTTHELVAAYLSGDSDASRIWLKSVRDLACAIGSFINILDPEIAIIGGGIARAGAALFEPLRRYVSEVEWRPGGHAVRIVPAELGEFAGAYGSAWNALTPQ